jgi:hypothetical protein
MLRNSGWGVNVVGEVEKESLGLLLGEENTGTRLGIEARQARAPGGAIDRKLDHCISCSIEYIFSTDYLLRMQALDFLDSASQCGRAFPMLEC